MDNTQNSPPGSSRVLHSPPRSPPSPANSDTDTKLSRKREREVSLEPVTTPKATTDNDPLGREYKDVRTPAKKNRIQLDSTAEEEDGVMTRSRSRSQSPGQDVDVSASPPQEMKIRVRQISQGVEDLSWQNMKDSTLEKTPALEMQPEDSDPVESADGSTEIKVDAQEPPSSDGAMDVPATDDNKNTIAAVAPSRRDSDSDSGEKEKGLKRKFLERGSSAGPFENGDESKAPTEPLKRPRDDPDKDENPRETKRPSPPPEKTAASLPPPPPSAAAPQLSGFMAYASTSSPFAAVKGQNLFASKKETSSTAFGTSALAISGTSSPFSVSGTASPFAAASSSTTSPFASAASSEPSSPPSSKRAVFGLSSSPFGASSKAKQDVLGSTSKLGRAKSPPPARRANPTAASNAFSAYASGGMLQGFAMPGKTRVRSGSPDDSGASSLERGGSTNSVLAANGSATDSGAEDEHDDRPTSFGEKLRAGKDEDEEKSDEENGKPVLTEQELTTGEEDEETLHQVRGKLFNLDGNQWRERGTGTIKLNVRRSDGGGARLVMRKEAVYTVLLNVTLFPGMRCELAQDPRYVRFSVIEGGAATHYNLRIASAKAAQELLGEINANIPTA